MGPKGKTTPMRDMETNYAYWTEVKVKDFIALQSSALGISAQDEL